MLSQFIKLIRVLSSETSPFQLSLGIGLAMIAGLTPFMSVHNIIVICLLLIFRINLGIFLIALPVFSGFAYIFDPVFHNIGQSLLLNQSLSGMWTDMYNSSLWRITRFNNTILMGSLIASIIAFIPVVVICNFFIRRYRTHIYEAIKNSRLFKFLKTSKLFIRAVSMAEK